MTGPSYDTLVLVRETLALALVLLPLVVETLDNGLARTPPMGWMAWERFRCNVDCVNDPDNCISEKLFMQMADRMAADGYKEAGYEYVCIDDCWMASQRDASGRLYADPTRFPNGIKKLADYVHSKGLKLGIYAVYGTKTCQGYPGSLGYLTVDAQTFADWGADYLKLDGCFTDVKYLDTGYSEMGRALNKTGRPMVYSCSWPYYQELARVKPNYKMIQQYCNSWRNYHDITTRWRSINGIIQYYTREQNSLIPLAGPGHWNDPDMILIGNPGLNVDQAKAQMAMWGVLASPLFMSNDLRNIAPEFKRILLNTEVIAINQDSLGKQGKMVTEVNGVEIYVKDLVHNSKAVVFLNAYSELTLEVTMTLDNLGFDSHVEYKLRDILNHVEIGRVEVKSLFTCKVPAKGAFMILAEAMSASRKREESDNSYSVIFYWAIFIAIIAFLVRVRARLRAVLRKYCNKIYI